jgi:hypothetical protein
MHLGGGGLSPAIQSHRHPGSWIPINLATDACDFLAANINPRLGSRNAKPIAWKARSTQALAKDRSRKYRFSRLHRYRATRLPNPESRSIVVDTLMSRASRVIRAHAGTDADSPRALRTVTRRLASLFLSSPRKLQLMRVSRSPRRVGAGAWESD